MPIITSAAYKAAVVKNNRTWRVKITMHLDSGNTLILTENDITLGSFVFEEASTCTETISVGSTYANTLHFSLQNPSNQFSQTTFAYARVVAEVGLQTGTSSNGSAIWEDVPLGEFFVMEDGKKMSTVPLKCMDRMVKLNGLISSLSLYPMESPASIMNKIRAKYGYTVDTVTQMQIANLDMQSDVTAFSDDMTCRDYIGYCAAYLGKNARFNREGKLEFFKNGAVSSDLTNTVRTTPATRLTDMSYSERPIQFTGVMVTDAYGEKHQVGTDEYMLTIKENPILIDGILVSEAANTIFSTVNQVPYVAFQTGIIGDPSIQAGDPVRHEYIHNSTNASDYISSTITNHRFKFRGNSFIEAKGAPLEANRQMTESAKRISEVERRAKEEINDALEAGQEALVAGQNALNAARQAEEEANAAVASANQAFTKASSALESSNEAEEKADAAFVQANSAFTNANTALSAVDGLQTTVVNEIARVDGQLSTKVGESTFDALAGRVGTAETTITQQAGQIASKASQSEVNTLSGRVSTAETSITQQSGQIALKASQSDVNTLTGRVTTAEAAITQQADSFTLSLAKHTKAVNDLTGANVVQMPWQQGTLSTSTGAESSSTGYVRSGWVDVTAGKKYLLQTYEGASAYSAYSTAYLFYYREDKSFLSYTTNTNSTTPFTAPTNACYLRVRYTTTAAPTNINCYLLQTETTGGYTDLTSLTNMVKIQATTDTLLLKVDETSSAIGTPFKVQQWERGTLDTSTGGEGVSSSYLRSEYIDVNPSEKYIAQRQDGSALSLYYFYYKPNTPYSEFTIPAPKQFAEMITTGTYNNSTVISYLNGKGVESMNITGSVGTNPYTSSGDYLTIYRLPLEGRDPPSVIKWNGSKDSSDNIVLLYTGNAWVQIGTVTATVSTVHEWTLTDAQQKGIMSDFIHIAFFSIKTGSYAGIYNNGTTPFDIALNADTCFLSYISSSSAVTIPAGCTKMRVRVTTSIHPDNYTGNIYAATTRQDYSKAVTLYSALLMQKDLINLRVAKDNVINQINISPENILIAGNKVHITGTTTIDTGVIKTAMIADASINTAKIADASITTAKIASLDASKITTGTLSASRIGAGTITADKLTANFLQTLTGSSSIRITGTTISYYSGSELTSQINSSGFELTRDGSRIGRIGTNNFSGQSTWRGLVFDLEYAGSYLAWAWKESSSTSIYTVKLTYFQRKLENGKEKGFHFDDVVFFKGNLGAASGSSTVTTQVNYLTLDSTGHYAMRTSNGKAGFAMGASNLVLGDDGQWVDFGTIREICKKLAGKTLALPTAFNSSGQATSWYNMTFNSMTWWTT